MNVEKCVREREWEKLRAHHLMHDFDAPPANKKKTTQISWGREYQKGLLAHVLCICRY